jgi:hypothetical protein
MTDASSVGGGTTSSHRSKKSNTSALARAFTFHLETRNVNYDPPALTKDLEELLTFGCGQLELSGKPGAGTGEPSFGDDGEEDDEVLARPVLFRGYLEFTQQITWRRVREWLATGDGENLEFQPAFLKDRELNIRVRTNPETRFRSKIDLIARAPWHIGKDERIAPGARTDMEEIRELLREHGPEEGVRQVAEKFPGQFIRYANGITQLAQAVVPKVREDADFKFRPWQAAIVNICKGKPHSRHIYWVEDPRGAAGKSRLTTYMCREMNAIELDGRQMDAAFSYTGQSIVLFDLARAVETATLKDLYIVGEKLKNGQIYSSKYQSRMKVFHVPHVIYFSNSPPPIGVWSADRLQHILLSEPLPFHVGSHDLEEGAEVAPELTGVELFNQLLDQEKAAASKAAGKKRAREEQDEEDEQS